MLKRIKSTLRSLGSYLKLHTVPLSIIVATAIASTIWSTMTTPHITGNPCWQPIQLRVPFSEHTFTYNMNCDSVGFIAAGHEFPEAFADDPTRMSRPIYPLIEKLMFDTLLNLGFDDGLLVGVYGPVFINFMLAVGSAIILYYIVGKFFNKLIAIISALLLLLSSHFHIFLGQAHTEVAGDFVVVLCLLLIYLYSRRPSTKRMVLFSLFAGLLMLLKFVFSLLIFTVLILLYFKKYRELAIFAPLFFLPSALWYLFVTQVMHLDFVSAEVSMYQQGTWFLHILSKPSDLYIIPYSYLVTLCLLVFDTLVAFGVVPVILATYGFVLWQYKHKNSIVFLFITSLTLMLYAMLFGGARFAFVLYPIVLPLAAYGLLEIWKKVGTKFIILKAAAVLALLAGVAWSQSNVYMNVPKNYNYDYNYVRTHINYCNEKIYLTCK